MHHRRFRVKLGVEGNGFSFNVLQPARTIPILFSDLMYIELLLFTVGTQMKECKVVIPFQILFKLGLLTPEGHFNRLPLFHDRLGHTQSRAEDGIVRTTECSLSILHLDFCFSDCLKDVVESLKAPSEW